jgi:hypothetical protein
MSKENSRYWLENDFPRFADDFAEVLVKRLTAERRKTLISERREAKGAAIRQFCETLLRMPAKARQEVIEQTARAEE